jgi:hypothetical protein
MRLEPGEECDTLNLNQRDCMQVLGLPDGDLSCTDQCTFDTSDCHDCGNGVAEGPEECDASDLGGQDCVSLGLGFTGGVLLCDTTCQYETSFCN